MKLRDKYFVLFCMLLLSALSCKKEYVGSYDEHYVGEWHTRDNYTVSGVEKEVYFIINGENSEYGFMCDLGCTQCACDLLTSGKAVIDRKHRKITIGSGNGKKKIKLKINTAPHLNDNGVWECTINDLVMTKK